uniref:Transposase domain-containing protein n=1 Tax=Amphimedon queenslandica TaxID=400682 RepID=A0A1X7TTT6_AMPQE
MRPGFLSSCEEWRQRESTIPSEYFADIYDGSVWKKFREGFLSTPYCYMLTLNVDWFQPFKHTQYSVGAIYLVIQNLPREQRYKEENIVLVGVMPGPHEPNLSIDSYLLPLTEELSKCYNEGIQVLTSNGISVNIRTLLSCISCDIPATRKVAGFLGHNARLGCNKCYKEFDHSSSGVVNYSGYERSLWNPRTASKHRSDCLKVESCKTKSETKKMESLLGVRPCALLKLPYFDPIQFVAIDIMHNLFLGTSKRIFGTWIEKGIITKQHLLSIDKLTSTFTVPSNIGRLPLNMSSNYLSFKAAQWSTWTTVYSPIVLKSILPNEDYRCWLLYVRACAILSQRMLTLSDINTADSLLLTFCKKVSELYGSDCCTPNMHLHLHLKETLLDFGPAHATWCFSFERFNGILGSMPTNKKSVEIQFFRTFIRKQVLLSQNKTIEDEDFKKFLPVSLSTENTYTLRCESESELHNILKLHYGPLELYPFKYSDTQGLIQLLDLGKEQVFTSSETVDIVHLYEQLNPGCAVVYVSPFYVCHGRIRIG